MLDQELAELLSLIFGSNAKRSEGKYLLPHAVLVLNPCLRVHDIADDLSRLCRTRAVKLKHECQFGDEVGMRAHRMDEIMLVCARFIDVPKRFACKFLNCSVVFFCL